MSRFCTVLLVAPPDLAWLACLHVLCCEVLLLSHSAWDQDTSSRLPHCIHPQELWVWSLCVDRCGHFHDMLSYTHLATIRVNDPSPSQWFVFLTGKATHCILRFYISYQFMPLTTVVGIADHLSATWLHLTTSSLSLLYLAALQHYRRDSL